MPPRTVAAIAVAVGFALATPGSGQAQTTPTPTVTVQQASGGDNSANEFDWTDLLSPAGGLVGAGLGAGGALAATRSKSKAERREARVERKLTRTAELAGAATQLFEKYRTYLDARKGSAEPNGRGEGSRRAYDVQLAIMKLLGTAALVPDSKVRSAAKNLASAMRKAINAQDPKEIDASNKDVGATMNEFMKTVEGSFDSELAT
jgi:hypothetical protein